MTLTTPVKDNFLLITSSLFLLVPKVLCLFCFMEFETPMFAGSGIKGCATSFRGIDICQ